MKKRSIYVLIGIIAITFIIGSIIILMRFVYPNKDDSQLDLNKKIKINACDLNKSIVKEDINNNDHNMPSEEIKDKLLTLVESLDSYKNFTHLYPPERTEYAMKFSYYKNDYLKSNNYSFSNNIKENSIIVRLFIDDGAIKIPESNGGKYNIFFDICNNKILSIDYQS